MVHSKRRDHKERIAAIFTKHLGEHVRIPGELAKAETSWFGVPVICHDPQLKERLVEHLETNRIQTRNYFAGNILLHPAYKHLGNSADFPLANKVLAQVFFVGCHSGYVDGMFDHIDNVVKSFSVL